MFSFTKWFVPSLLFCWVISWLLIYFYFLGYGISGPVVLHLSVDSSISQFPLRCLVSSCSLSPTSSWSPLICIFFSACGFLFFLSFFTAAPQIQLVLPHDYFQYTESPVYLLLVYCPLTSISTCATFWEWSRERAGRVRKRSAARLRASVSAARDKCAGGRMRPEHASSGKTKSEHRDRDALLTLR